MSTHTNLHLARRGDNSRRVVASAQFWPATRHNDQYVSIHIGDSVTPGMNGITLFLDNVADVDALRVVLEEAAEMLRPACTATMGDTDVNGTYPIHDGPCQLHDGSTAFVADMNAAEAF